MEPINLLPVETFREHIAYNAFHFWGLSGDDAPVTSACNTIVYEYDWQAADAAGRDGVRKAVIEAEKKFNRHLGYWTRPNYIQETINLGCFKHYSSNCGREYYDYYRPGYTNLVKLSSGQLIAIQTETWAPLAAGAAVQYFDDDADGNLDRFQILITVVNLAAVDIDNIELRFLAADAPFSWPTNRLKIAPIYVDRFSPTQIRIQGPAWIMVSPKKYGAYNYAGLDPATAAPFVATADVYLKTISATNVASFLYYDSNNVLQTQAVDVSICDPDSGLVIVSSNTCLDFCYCGTNRSQNFVVNYRAGAEAGLFDASVTRLAIAELRKRVCACDEANGEIYSWQVDMALPAGASMAKIHIDAADLANPIGTRAGQIAAWKEIQLVRQAHGIFVG